MSTSFLLNSYTQSMCKMKNKAHDMGAIIAELEVSGLNKNMCDSELKHRVGAEHVIATQTERNVINNECTGKASIKVRISSEDEINRIKNKLSKSLGANVVYKSTENNGLKDGTQKEMKKNDWIEKSRKEETRKDFFSYL